ncbi:MAG: B12-binding domain-containing radical SAM protein [Desulfobacteraceae bacterium]
MPSLILINPWIHDFAAYDMWSKPLGLLYIARYLIRYGFRVHLIDCLNVHHPGMQHAGDPPPKRRSYGTGKFRRSVIPPPEPLKHIQRPYSRYGITPEIFKHDLQAAEKPSAMLVTSLMTYWYPGVVEAIQMAKAVYPDVPVILGGIYARLCTRHALQCSGADQVISKADMESLLSTLDTLGIPVPKPGPLGHQPLYPAFDLLNRIDYVCIQTGSGCLYRCEYCASPFLYPRLVRRPPQEVLEEILFWHRTFQVRDFAFYDDALLVDSPNHAAILLQGLKQARLDLRFHTPNALHIKEVTREIAQLMYDTGFKTIRLGLETADFTYRRTLDRKVEQGDFERAVSNLFEAGFKPRDVGAYILMGLPDQTVGSVMETLDLVEKCGVTPYLVEYSPIPHTPLWQRARAVSPCDIEAEPLFHNNTLFPCWDEEKKRTVPQLKERVSRIRQSKNHPCSHGFE